MNTHYTSEIETIKTIAKTLATMNNVLQKRNADSALIVNSSLSLLDKHLGPYKRELALSTTQIHDVPV